MLDDLGLYEKMEPRGLISPKFQYWDRVRDEMFAEFDHAVLRNDTRFPYVLQCERGKIIDEAMQLLRQHPECEIRMATTFARPSPRTKMASRRSSRNEAGEEERIRGSFIVSAEGGRSNVRRTLGIEFEGYTYPERTLTVCVCYDFDRHHGYAYRNYLSDPGPVVESLQMGAAGALARALPDQYRRQPGGRAGRRLHPGAVAAFLPRSQPYEVVHRTLYTVHQRVAPTFRVGRAILAGDAAHVMSPIGAMGMNSGIHDAVNLGEKLVAILRGESGLEVLDRYTRQRRHVAVNHTTAQTARNKKLLEEKDPAVRQRNHDHLRRTAGDPALAREFLLRTSLIKSVQEAAAIE